ncbi:MAG: hypothetical protein U0457_05390 [Candidatus Sericytochromatia bacterium]
MITPPKSVQVINAIVASSTSSATLTFNYTGIEVSESGQNKRTLEILDIGEVFYKL